MEWAIVAGLLLVGAFEVYFLIDQNRHKATIEKKLREIEDFSPSRTVIKAKRGVSFDTERQKVVFVTDAQTFLQKNFKDIIGCEIVMDGETVTRTSRTNILGGAALGGATLGGAGAIVGAMAGGNKTSSKTVTKNVAVRFLINDLKTPSYELSYIELTHTGETLPETAKIEAQSLYDFVQVIIHQQKQTN